MNHIEQIRKWCTGIWLAEEATDAEIKLLSIDTRSIEQPEKTLFIALKTNLRDGHNYIPDAWQKGVRNFLVSQSIDTTGLTGANIIEVKDTLTALQQISAAHRRQFHIPVIGITGSNGKTMVDTHQNKVLLTAYAISAQARAMTIPNQYAPNA